MLWLTSEAALHGRLPNHLQGVSSHTLYWVSHF